MVRDDCQHGLSEPLSSVLGCAPFSLSLERKQGRPWHDGYFVQTVEGDRRPVVLAFWSPSATSRESLQALLDQADALYREYARKQKIYLATVAELDGNADKDVEAAIAIIQQTSLGDNRFNYYVLPECDRSGNALLVFDKEGNCSLACRDTNWQRGILDAVRDLIESDPMNDKVTSSADVSQPGKRVVEKPQ